MCRGTKSPAPGDSARPAFRQLPLASHCPPPLKLHYVISYWSHCCYPSESLVGTAACHGHRQWFCRKRSHQGKPAGDQRQAGSVGDQPEGKGKEAVAKSGCGGAGRMNRLVREGASRASTALSFGGSTSFRGAPLQPTVRCQCGDVSSSVCWAGGRTNRSNWGHVRHWKKRILWPV